MGSVTGHTETSKQCVSERGEWRREVMRCGVNTKDKKSALSRSWVQVTLFYSAPAKVVLIVLTTVHHYDKPNCKVEGDCEGGEELIVKGRVNQKQLRERNQKKRENRGSRWRNGVTTLTLIPSHENSERPCWGREIGGERDGERVRRVTGQRGHWHAWEGRWEKTKRGGTEGGAHIRHAEEEEKN